MRVAIVSAVALLAACAGETLKLTPPVGVDFSGRWTLNAADSDDPMRLMQSQITGPAAGSAGSTGGRGGRRGGGAGGGIGGPGGLVGPSMPSIDALGESFQWPGKDIEIKQVAGVVAFTSNGRNRVYQPAELEKSLRHHRRAGRSDDPQGRTAMPARGDGPPAVCGWDDKTLVVEGGDVDEDQPPFEKRYSVTTDGQRLVEVVGFKGGRSSGFTVSRVWDRVSPSAPGRGTGGAPP